MENNLNKNKQSPTFEERKLQIEEKKLELESSFAKKWLPAMATLMIGIIAMMYNFSQQYISREETKKANIEAQKKDEREWGFKIIELYLNKRDLFDITKSPATASKNLIALIAVAPTMIQSILKAEKLKLPPPSTFNDTAWINRLAAVSEIQDALSDPRPVKSESENILKPSDFVIYIQYTGPDKGKAQTAKSIITGMGYRVPGIEKVSKVPAHLKVWYYRQEQKALAEALCDKLLKGLNLQQSPDNVDILKSSRKLPWGIMEVWLPKPL